MPESLEITTVGSLRRAMEGLPDDRIIILQVIAVDGCVCNLFARFAPMTDEANCTLSVIDGRHPALRSLVCGDDLTIVVPTRVGRDRERLQDAVVALIDAAS